MLTSNQKIKYRKVSGFLVSFLLLYSVSMAQQTEDYKTRGLKKEYYYDEKGQPRPDLYRKSILEHASLKKASVSYLGTGTVWSQSGPAPANVNSYLAGNGQLPGPNAGSVVDIAIDPEGKKDSIIYVVSNSGGIWKSTDGGKNWVPKTDFLPTLSIGAIAMDPVNPKRIYAGTGNIFNNGYIMSIGIFISPDRGETWIHTGDTVTLKGKAINKMAVTQPGTILVASENGFFRSIDDGNTFVEIPVGGKTGRYITDLDVQEGNTNNVWVCVSGNGIYASTNSGASFGSNLWGAGHDSVPSVPYSFTSLGVSSDGQTLYANAALNSGGAGLWKSTNGGNTWKNLSAKISKPLLSSNYSWRDINACQCGYDQTLAVDPSNSSRVYMGFQDMWISEDGGNTWNDATLSFAPKNSSYTELMHVDHHALLFSPPSHRVAGNAVNVWVGNDGGVWSSPDSARTWINHNQGSTSDSSLATHLFRQIDIGRGANNNQWTYGGTQDNGTSVGKPVSGTTAWNEWSGGDGSYAAVDWQNPQLAYGNWGATSNGGGSLTSCGYYYCIKCSSGNTASIAVAKTGPTSRKVYFGGNCSGKPTLFTSTDFGNTVTQAWQPSGNAYGNISSMAVTLASPNVLFVTAGQTVYKLNDTNGTITGTPVSVPGISGQSPMLAINPANANMIAAVYTGYSGAAWPSPSRHVFLSSDGGNTWKDISGTVQGARIPDMPIFDVVIDPNTMPNSILVSSDFGVYRTFDFGLTWHVTGQTLPNVHSVSLALDPQVTPSLVRVGTFGRSTWEANLGTGKTVFGPFNSKLMSVGSTTWQNNSNDTLFLSFVNPDGKGESKTTTPLYSLVGNTKNFFTSPGNGQPTFVSDFTGDKKSDMLFFNPGDQNWWLGEYSSASKTMAYSLVGNTKNFLTSPGGGQPAFVSDFTGDKKSDMLFFNPGDQNWWLGEYSPASKQIAYALVGNTKNFLTSPGSGQPAFVSDFTGDGKSDLLFFNPGDQNWWLGEYSSASKKMAYSLVGNTKNFLTSPGSGQPTFVSDFTGDGKSDMLFFNPGDQNWWLGEYSPASKQIAYALVGNTKNFLTSPGSGQPAFVRDFTGDKKSDLLFFNPGDQNWWLGEYSAVSKQIAYSLVGNTKNFLTSPGGAQPAFASDFSGDGKSDLLFFNPGDQNWWMGEYSAASKQITYTFAGNTNNFLTSPGSGQPAFVSNFSGSGKSELLFFNPGDQNWWLGKYSNSLYPGQKQAYPANYNGVGVLRDKSGNIVLVYVNNGNINQAVAVSQTTVNLAKTNKIQSYPGIRSLTNTGQTVSSFTVVNNSNTTITINWLDMSGIPHPIATVTPTGNTLIGPVYIGGTFTATDSQGRLIGVYVASDAGQSFTISQQMVNFWGY